MTEASSKLTRNQTLVLAVLTSATGPLTAYAILDLLRVKGFKAPLQVYRALDKLVACGMAHRLESMNAFVACRHPAGEKESTVAFTICETCGEVTEIANETFEKSLAELAVMSGFTLKKSMIELFGRCDQCD